MKKSQNTHPEFVQQLKAFLIDIFTARADFYKQQHDSSKQ